MSHSRILFSVCLGAGFVLPLWGQSDAAHQAGRRSLLARATEVSLARSAAPAEVSWQAAVYVLTDTGYALAEPGTNGVSCLVDRSRRESLEPHCFDAEGSASVLQIRLREGALRQQGKSVPEIDREIADALKSGRLRLPRRPAMSYMLSAGQVLYSDEGKAVGKWQPHLMIYSPYVTAAELGLSGPPSTRAAMVVDEGQPLASILIVVRDFVEPAAVASKP